MKKLLLSLFGVLLVGLLLGYGTSWYYQQGQNTSKEVRVIITKDVPLRELQLYFTEPGGTFLVPESYEIPACDEDNVCWRGYLWLVCHPFHQAVLYQSPNARLQARDRRAPTGTVYGLDVQERQSESARLKNTTGALPGA